MPAEPAVSQPRHPLPELTTYELRDYRRDLEHAIASAARPDPASRELAALRIQLDAVLAEQESRAALTARGTTRS
jgi:hypothetical protein